MRGTHSFAERDILRNCGRGNADAGMSDLATGRVLEIEADGDDTIEGNVAGRSGRMVWGGASSPARSRCS